MGESSKRKDPLPVYCFKVEVSVDGITGLSAFFKTVTGLKYETDVVDFKEGGVNLSTHRLVGSTKWANIVLSRGFCQGDSMKPLLAWRDAWMDESKAKLKRANGKITMLRTDLSPACSWEFIDGWPCKWEGPDLDASKSELAIEKLEIAHHGLKFSG